MYIIFGGNTKLINFDLTNKIGSCYPQGYNNSFPERHPNATENDTRQTIHDRFNHQINAFTVSKDEWNTKEDTGKSLNNALHILQCAKRHLSE